MATVVPVRAAYLIDPRRRVRVDASGRLAGTIVSSYRGIDASTQTPVATGHTLRTTIVRSVQRIGSSVSIG
jgi:hypothetical protein